MRQRLFAAPAWPASAARLYQPAAAASSPTPSSSKAPRQGLTLVPVSAQLELTLPLSDQLKLILSLLNPN